MKKIFLVLFILGLNKASLAQNTYPWPSAGNVGIGITTPQKTFEVNTVYNDFATIGTAYLQSGQFSGIHFGYYEPDNQLYRKSAIVFERTDIHARGKIHILNNAGTSQSASLSDARFTINYDGNIGIGTTNPLDKLSVEGADMGVRINGSERARLNLITTAQQGWQIEVGNANSNGNQLAGDLGFTESGVSGGRLVLKKGGNVGIGTITPDSKLTVAGKIHSQEVKVSVNAGADFVFDKEYKLRSLAETEKYISANKHLPEIESAEEMKKNGLELGEMNIKLLQKIEELTLHLIEVNKKFEGQEVRMKEQEEKIEKQQIEINQMKSKF